MYPSGNTVSIVQGTQYLSVQGTQYLSFRVQSIIVSIVLGIKYRQDTLYRSEHTQRTVEDTQYLSFRTQYLSFRAQSIYRSGHRVSIFQGTEY